MASKNDKKSNTKRDEKKSSRDAEKAAAAKSKKLAKHEKDLAKKAKKDAKHDKKHADKHADKHAETPGKKHPMNDASPASPPVEPEAPSAHTPGEAEVVSESPITADAASTAPTLAPSEAWTVTALRARARALAIPGYSRMTKAELLDKIVTN